uniref:Uncharacterized protein n=1 Tax=Oryza barthii TaxID=65489 RepID=A0A0D3HWH9_9ORYZ
MVDRAPTTRTELGSGGWSYGGADGVLATQIELRQRDQTLVAADRAPTVERRSVEPSSNSEHTRGWQIRAMTSMTTHVGGYVDLEWPR